MVPEARAITSRPDLGRPGEGDLGHVGVLDQAGADHRALAHHHLEHALGDSGVEGQLGQADRGQRGDLGRLDHDGVAGGQRRADLPRGDGDGEVPRHDGRRPRRAARGRSCPRRRPPARWRRGACPPPRRRSRGPRRPWPPRRGSRRWACPRCPSPAGPAPRRAPRPGRRTGASAGPGRPAPPPASAGPASSDRATASSASSTPANGSSAMTCLGGRVDDTVGDSSLMLLPRLPIGLWTGRADRAEPVTQPRIGRGSGRHRPAPRTAGRRRPPRDATARRLTNGAAQHLDRLDDPVVAPGRTPAALAPVRRWPGGGCTARRRRSPEQPANVAPRLGRAR